MNDSYGTPRGTTAQGQTSYCNAKGAPLITLIANPWLYPTTTTSNYDTADNPTFIPYGSKPSVSFYYTLMTFACHQNTSHNTVLYGISTPPPGNGPADDSLVALNQQNVSTYIENASVAGSTNPNETGSVSGLTGYDFNEAYQGGTRYWFPTSTVAGSNVLNFNASSNYTTPGDVYITVKATQRLVNTDADGTFVCVYNGATIPGGLKNSAGQYLANGGDARTAIVKGSSSHCPDNSGAPVQYTIWLRIQSRPPSVNITTNPLSCNSSSLTGSASDPDDPSKELSIQLRVDGNYVGSQTTTNHKFSFNISSYISSGSSHSFTVTAIGVDQNGTPDGVNTSQSVSSSACIPNPCPPFTQQGYDYKNVQASLPYQGPNNAPHPGTSSQPPGSPAPQPYEEDDPVKVQFKNAPDQALTDISPGTQNNSANAMPVYISEVDTWPNSPPQSGNGSINLDYSNYYHNYPYDDNQPKIGYDSYYNKTVWTPKYTSTSYGCRPGDSTGYNGSPTTCYYYDWLFTRSTTCYAPTDSGPDANGYCYYPATATADNYSWTPGSASSEYQASNTSGVLMPACLNRTFSLTPIDSQSNGGHPSTVGWGTGDDNPSSLSVNGYVQAQYGVTNQSSVTSPGPYFGTFRQSTQVNGITTDVQVQIYHAYGNGVIGAPTPVGTPYSGTSPNIKSNYTAGDNQFLPAPPHQIPDYNNLSWGEAVALASQGGALYYGDMACINIQTDVSRGEVNPDSGWSAQNVTVGQRNEQPDPAGPGPGAEDPWPTASSAFPYNPPSVCTGPLQAKPYVKVYGSDAMAGMGAGNIDKATSTKCYNSNADAQSWNIGSSPYNGAGTLLAALVAGNDNGFASAQANAANAPPGNGLSFANVFGATYGGNFGASITDCAPDYYSKIPTTAVNEPDAQTALNTALGQPAGTYSYVVPGGTLASATIPAGYNIAIFSTGPVNVNGNITYASASPGSVPSFTLVNNDSSISIANNVTSLAGNYVAQYGTIDDCASIPSNQLLYDADPIDIGQPDSTQSNTCGYRLTINGSFVAKDILLKRTAYNNVGTASTYHLATGDNACPVGCPPSSKAAEEFNYSPLEWLAPPPQSGGPTVQSITSVPPVL